MIDREKIETEREERRRRRRRSDVGCNVFDMSIAASEMLREEKKIEVSRSGLLKEAAGKRL